MSHFSNHRNFALSFSIGCFIPSGSPFSSPLLVPLRSPNPRVIVYCSLFFSQMLAGAGSTFCTKYEEHLCSPPSRQLPQAWRFKHLASGNCPAHPMSTLERGYLSWRVLLQPSDQIFRHNIATRGTAISLFLCIVIVLL